MFWGDGVEEMAYNVEVEEGGEGAKRRRLMRHPLSWTALFYFFNAGKVPD